MFDAFHMTNRIAGECTDDAHKEWIDISGVNLGSESIDGRASSHGVVAAQAELPVSKYIDKSSSLITCAAEMPSPLGHMREVASQNIQCVVSILCFGMNVDGRGEHSATLHKSIFIIFLVALILGITACGGGKGVRPSPATYTIGGTVSGLEGAGLVLRNNGVSLVAGANGTFVIPTAVSNGAKYVVTVAGQPTNPAQTCTVTNGAGTVIGANVTNVAVNCVTNKDITGNGYTISGAVSGLTGAGLVLQNNGRDNLSVAADGSFTFATTVADGGDYNVTVLAPPSTPDQNCTVTNGAGKVIGANVTNLHLSCARLTVTAEVTTYVGRFVYVANAADNTVSIYSVNAATGQLRPNGYVATAGRPTSVAVDPSGRFAYVTNTAPSYYGKASIISYSINASTGALTPIGSPMTTWGDPISVTVDPSGRFVYVTHSTSVVSSYSINASTGALTPIGAPVATGTHPISITFEPSGRFVYVGNSMSRNISTYSFNASTGALTPVGSPVAANPTHERSLAVDPSGRFVYVANLGANNILIYSINASTGVLTPIGTPVATGDRPSSVAVDPLGRFAYVANSSSNDVSTYAIDSITGALTTVGARVASANTPTSIIVDPSGKFAYVLGFSHNNVSAYSINPATGVLKPLGTVSARSQSSAIVLTKGTTPVRYTPKFAYVANSGGISAYTIDSQSGALTFVGNAVAGKVGASNPQSIAVDPSGRFAYVADYFSHSILVYAIDSSTGQLSSALFEVPVAPENGPNSITFDPSGRFVYVTNSNTNSVLAGWIDTFPRGIVRISERIAAGKRPVSITVDPSGRFAYVANIGSNSVSAYSTNSTTGVLTSIAKPVAAGKKPVSVTVHPSGRFVYVANYGSNNISTYFIDHRTGELMSGFTMATGTGPCSTTIDPTGRFAYVVNCLQGVVSAYTIDPKTGVLTSIGLGVNPGKAPSYVTVEPSGRFAYVTNQGDNTISLYKISASGALTRIGAPMPAGKAPSFIITTGTIE